MSNKNKYRLVQPEVVVEIFEITGVEHGVFDPDLSKEAMKVVMSKEKHTAKEIGTNFTLAGKKKPVWISNEDYKKFEFEDEGFLVFDPEDVFSFISTDELDDYYEKV